METAEKFGYNPDYLSRAIQKATGYTFKKVSKLFIVWKQQERNLLILINLFILLSQESGFSNLNYFYKKFNAYFGGFPADYRKQFQAK